MKTKENFSELISILEDETNLTYVKILFITKLSYDSINLKDPSNYNDFVSIGCCTKNTKIKESYNSEYETPYYTHEKNYDNFHYHNLCFANYEGFCINNDIDDVVKNTTFEYSCNEKINHNKVSNVYYKLSVQDYETYIKPVIDKIVAKNNMVYQSLAVKTKDKSNNKFDILNSNGISPLTSTNKKERVTYTTKYIETNWIMLIKPLSLNATKNGIYLRYVLPASFITCTLPKSGELTMHIYNRSIIKNGYSDCSDAFKRKYYYHYETNMMSLISKNNKNKSVISFLTQVSIPSVIQVNVSKIERNVITNIVYVKGFYKPSKISSDSDYLQMIKYFGSHIDDYVAVGKIIDSDEMTDADKYDDFSLNEVYILKSELAKTHLEKDTQSNILTICVNNSNICFTVLSTTEDINEYAAYTISEKRLLDAYKEVLPEDKFKEMYVKYELDA